MVTACSGLTPIGPFTVGASFIVARTMKGLVLIGPPEYLFEEELFSLLNQLEKGFC